MLGLPDPPVKAVHVSETFVHGLLPQAFHNLKKGINTRNDSTKSTSRNPLPQCTLYLLQST